MFRALFRYARFARSALIKRNAKIKSLKLNKPSCPLFLGYARPARSLLFVKKNYFCRGSLVVLAILNPQNGGLA